MTDFQYLIEMLAVFGLLFLTFWRKDIILYLLMWPLMIGFGLHWYDNFGTPMAFMIALTLMGVGVFCLALGIYNLLRGREQ